MQENTLSLSGLFASAFISSTLAPGGSEAVLAYLVVSARYPVEQLLVVATVGNTLGAMTTWLLGVFAAKKYSIAELLPRKRQNALRWMNRFGLWTLFFSWLPVIGDALCFAGGWLKLPWLPACLIILIGKFTRYALITWLFV